MISRSYIHEYAPHDQFMCESYYLLLESKDTLNDLIRLENMISEKTYFGENVDNEIIVLEAEKKNIFTRIGEVIIQLFDSFIDFLKDTGNAIKDSITGARKKSGDDKLKNAMKNDPSLAKDFLQGVMSGNIKAHDVKDLNGLLDEATKITNDLMNGKIDKKTHGERIDEALKKFGDRARNIAAILGLVGTTAAVVKGVDELIHGGTERKLKRVKGEVDLYNALSDNRNRMKAEHRVEFAKKAGVNLESDIDTSVIGNYVTEATSFTDIIQKIMTFFTDHVSFCSGAVEKLKDLKSSLASKAKESKDSEEGEKVNVAITGLRKIMGVITKELTTIKNSANKVEGGMEV